MNIVFYILTYILVVLFTYKISENIFINNFKYGTVFSTIEKKFMNISFQFIKIPFDDLLSFCPKPPLNNSSQTYQELLFLQRKVQQSTFQEEKIFNLLDENASFFFHQFIDTHNLKININELSQFVRELEQITFRLKYVFNRPRAFQLGSYFNIPVKSIYPVTGNSPAYPSGHASIAYGYSYYLSHFYPTYTEQFKNIAKIVDYSRINVGVHYVSDGKASQILVDKIFKQIKHKFRG